MRIGNLPSLIPRELPGLDDAASALRAGGALGTDRAGGAGAIATPDAPFAATGAEKGGFSNILSRAVNEVDGKMQAAKAEQAKVLTGESTNLHQAMISMQEASVAFTLMVEVRNKLVESYQELMRMQV
jgi:flagellar hook-basal body complex protein FliE